MCTTLKQPSSNLQASKPPKSERKNTHPQCVFCRAKGGSRPKEVNLHFQYTTRVCIPQCRDARLERPIGRQTNQSR